MDGGKGKERTVHQRKHKVDYLSIFPWLEEADPILIEKKVRGYHHL